MVKQFAANVLLFAVRRKDGEAAFDRFLAEQREPLLGFLRHRTRSEADAQDVVQESMVRLLRYRDRQPEEAWKPLLYRIAVNVLHDHARRFNSRCGEGHESLGMEVENLPADEPSMEQRLSDQQELARIRSLILQLPTRCREIYLLNRIEGMSYSEIATHCGISVKAVEKQITKALAALRKGVGAASPDPFKEP